MGAGLSAGIGFLKEGIFFMTEDTPEDSPDDTEDTPDETPEDIPETPFIVPETILPNMVPDGLSQGASPIKLNK